MKATLFLYFSFLFYSLSLSHAFIQQQQQQKQQTVCLFIYNYSSRCSSFVTHKTNLIYLNTKKTKFGISIRRWFIINLK
jgi:hypothetical protein